jgi:phosphohistidine phosphatase
MTLRLILMRHAKSGWDDPLIGDHDRPLSPRGILSARALARWLNQTGLQPDRVLCSTAQRTRETLALLDLDQPVEFLGDLYLAGEDTLMDIIQAQHSGTLHVVAHNPGIAQLAGLLVQSRPSHPRFNDYPTGATSVIEFPVSSWGQIGFGTGRLIDFVLPRDIIEKTAP